MDLKKVLAGEVVAALHDIEAAMAARHHFAAQFSQRSFTDVDTLPTVPASYGRDTVGVVTSKVLEWDGDKRCSLTDPVEHFVNGWRRRTNGRTASLHRLSSKFHRLSLPLRSLHSDPERSHYLAEAAMARSTVSCSVIANAGCLWMPNLWMLKMSLTPFMTNCHTGRTRSMPSRSCRNPSTRRSDCLGLGGAPVRKRPASWRS